jgi:hypothetical protein
LPAFSLAVATRLELDSEEIGPETPGALRIISGKLDERCGDAPHGT